MADIQYLNYGDQQIEQQALLNNMANDVQSYVKSQPWSKKRKDKFMSAYLDLINRGLDGAYNDSGIWKIRVKGGDLNLNNMPKKDREMYQEAAYFIQQKMSGLPTKSSEKEELPVFDFNKTFDTHVKNWNGGKTLEIGGEKDQWNYLDKRDATGKRGRTNRAAKLADLLQSYLNDFDETKYNFEGSPYKNADDFRTRMNSAITALRTPDLDDDKPALQVIGLNDADWFNNGLNDLTGKTLNGTELTYKQLGDYNKLLAQQSVESVGKALKRVKDFTNNVKEYKKNREDVLDAAKNVSEIAGKFSNNISRNQKLSETGLSDADYYDLAGIAADIASLVYPGWVGGAVFGGVGAGARLTSSLKRGDFSLGNTLLDFGTAAIGGLPLFGDALMIGKIGRNLKAFLQTYSYGRAAFEGAGLGSVVEKITNGDFGDITTDEWKRTLSVIRDALGGAKITKANATALETARKSGLDVKNNWFRTVSGYGPTVKYNRIVKAKVKLGETEKDVDIPIDTQTYETLKGKLRRVGNGEKGQAKRQEIIKNAIEEDLKGMEGFKNVDMKDVSISYTPTWRNNIINPFKNNSSTFRTDYPKNRVNDTDFENFLKNRTSWDKFRFGSNRILRSYRKRAGLTDEIQNSKFANVINRNPVNPEKPTGDNITGSPRLSQKPMTPNQNVNEALNEMRAFRESYFGEGVVNGYKNNIPSVENRKGQLSFEIEGQKFVFDFDSGNGSYGELMNAREKIAKQALDMSNKVTDVEEVSRILKELKLKGWLKKGGKL